MEKAVEALPRRNNKTVLGSMSNSSCPNPSASLLRENTQNFGRESAIPAQAIFDSASRSGKPQVSLSHQVVFSSLVKLQVVRVEPSNSQFVAQSLLSF